MSSTRSSRAHPYFVTAPPTSSTSDDVRRRYRLASLLWPLALVAFGNLVFRSYTAPRGIDFGVLHEGAQRFVDRESVYADPYFLLTPSGQFIVAPFGAMSAETAFPIWNTLSIVAAVAGAACAVRFVGASLRGPVAAATLLGLSITEALSSTLLFGNLNNSLLLALGSGFLLAASRGRVVLAGVLLGLSLAVKPVLVLVLLLLLFRREWRALFWAVTIPAALTVAGLLATPAAGDFFDVTVPELLHARLDANSSMWAVGTMLEVPSLLVAMARVAVLALAVVLVWRLRNIVDPVVGFSASYGLCLLATWLAASLSEGYYSMLLVPVLLTVITPGSPVASPLTWFAVWLFGGLDRWDTGSSRNVDPEFARPGWGGGGGPRWGNPFERDVPNDFERSRWTAGWLLLYAVLVVWAFRTHRSPPSQRSDDPRPADVGSEAPAGHVGSGVTG